MCVAKFPVFSSITVGLAKKKSKINLSFSSIMRSKHLLMLISDVPGFTGSFGSLNIVLPPLCNPVEVDRTPACVQMETAIPTLFHTVAPSSAKASRRLSLPHLVDLQIAILFFPLMSVS